MPWQVCLTACWSVFDACCLGELAAALVGVLDWVLGGMVGVAVVVVNGMVVGGRKLIDVATNKQPCVQHAESAKRCGHIEY